MRHKFMSFIGAIIVLVVLGSAFGSGDEESATSGDNATAGESVKKDKVYAVNKPVVINKKAEVVVTKVEELSVIGDPEFLGHEASDGGTLVAIQTTVKNISDEPIGSFSTPTFELVDEKGTSYDSDISASSAYAVETDIDNSKILSDLNPGITVNDVQVYEVSKESYAKGKWYIEISGKEKVKIK
ncbi:MAG: DUF4352 domain-containing protein [Kurthia sp.]|nr:DUF4352 domain-containing protein [Candidatus Kurthia equi]